MKVAIVTAFPRDLSAPHGGVEAVSVILSQALAEFDDLQVHVVTCDSQQSAPETTALDRITVHRLPAPKGSELVTAVTTKRRLVSAYLRHLKPDIVHAHDTYGLMVTGLDLPRVFTIHGFIHADTLVSDERFPRLRSYIWKVAETRGWAAQPHIISISPYVRERISRIANGSIHDIENPISARFFELPRSEEPGTIFSSAVISPRKNTLVLIDAIRDLVQTGYDVRLRLAGAVGDARFGDAVMQKIRSEKLEEHVSVLGQLGREGIQLELARACIYALVSLEENAPIGIEEAMAAGVPAVASNRCGMPYMVRHHETGFLVDPTDPHQIAQRIRRLLDDGSLRSAMGERSRSVARELYHPRRVAERTRIVYREAIEGV